MDIQHSSIIVIIFYADIAVLIYVFSLQHLIGITDTNRNKGANGNPSYRIVQH